MQLCVTVLLMINCPSIISNIVLFAKFCWTLDLTHIRIHIFIQIYNRYILENNTIYFMKKNIYIYIFLNKTCTLIEK